MNIRRVLVAEDSATQREHLRYLLADAGYEVITARDGAEGLTKAGEDSPDLIISDVVMPDLNGFELCRAVKSDPKLRRVPFALLTSQRTPGDVIRGIEVGADNFIPKPFEDTELIARVGRIFENLERRRREGFDLEVKVRVGGREIVVNADKEQMLELLFEISEELSDTNLRLGAAQQELEAYTQQLEERVEDRTRELKEARHFLDRIIDSMPGIVYIYDVSEGRNVYANRELEGVLGYTPDQVAAMGASLIREIVHPDDLLRVEAHYARCREARDEQTYELNYRASTRAGEWRWLRCREVAFERAGDGSVSKLLGVAIDETEQRHTEDLLRQAQKIEAIGRLAGGVAHDFNSVLGVVTGYAELARRQIEPGHPLEARLDAILGAAERGAQLTRQLLAFSRKQAVQPRVLDLNRRVADAQHMLHRLIGEDVELVVHSAPDLGAVKADPGQLDQVILNLAVNARDAMPGGGRLTFETANVYLDEEYAAAHPEVEPGRYVQLTVSDTGTGMDEATLHRIFDPFFTTKPEGRGTGIGLATVYGIVRRAGGFIWVYSEPGHGTTFKVYLPRVDDAVETDDREDRPAEVPRGHERILLVEDTPALREVVCEMLTDQGYQVIEAPDGEAAIGRAGACDGRIDLLLTDVVMPGLGGAELARRLRAVHPELRVVYMSGYTEGTVAGRGVPEGAAVLEKPFTEAKLARCLRAALGTGPQ